MYIRGVRKIRREYCYDKMDHGLVRSPKYYFIESEHNKVTQLK